MSTDTLEFPSLAPQDAATQAIIAATKPAALDLEKLDLSALAVAKFGDWRGDVAKVRKTLDGAVHDLSTQAKVDEAKSLRFRLIGQPRADVRKVSKGLKSKLAAVSKIVGAEEEAAVAAYDSAETLITPQIEARETELAAEKAEAARILAERQQKQAEDVAGIRGYLTRAQTAADMTAERVANGIKMLEGMTFAEADWLDPVAAASAQCETLEGMRALQTTLKAREDAAAALAAQQQAAALLAQQQAEQQALLDAQAKRLRDEQDRIACLQARIAEIRAAATGQEHASAADLAEARTVVAALDVSEAAYQEFAILAEASKAATLSVLDKLHAEAVAREDAAKAKAQQEIEAARQRAITPAANVATAAATEGKADNPEPGTLEAAPITQDAQESGFCAGTPAVYASSAADSATAAPSGDEGTGAHADVSAPSPAPEPMPQPGVAPQNHQLPEADAAPGMGTAEPAAKPMTDDECAEMVANALRRAYSLGQTYWQQADSESITQHKKADVTARKFQALVDGVRAELIKHLQALA